jgi:hypothetical protein
VVSAVADSVFCDFLERLQYRSVGWILTMKGGFRVGMKCQKWQRLIRLDGATFNNHLGAEALMECRGGGHGSKDNMTEAITTKMATTVLS